jgi:hypothetical protein
MNMAIVTGNEVVAYMGGLELTSDQMGVIEMIILPGVQQELENYLNRPIQPVHVRESLRPDDTGFLMFRTTPIHQILSVTLSDGSTAGYAPTTPPTMSTIEDYRNYDEWGEPELYGYQLEGVPFGLGFGSIYGYPIIGSRPFYRVEYIAGYNGYVNEGLKLDICRVAAREVEMQFDDTMSLRGGSAEAASNSDAREKGWTGEELVKWDRLRRRVAV